MKKGRIGLALLLAALLCAQTALAQGVTPSEAHYGGEKIPTVEMHMTGYAYADVQQLVADLQAAGTPQSVDIRPAVVPLEELQQVLTALPGTTIFCQTQLCGKDVDTSSMELDLSGSAPEDLQGFSQALGCFPRLSKVVLCNCKSISNQQMEALCEAHPDIEFIWTVYFGTWSLRTDALAFSTLNSNDSKRYSSEVFSVLRYCTKLRALDLGHNVITDISFLEAMPDLKILILADNDIVDISPLAKCKKLEYIELFMNEIVDFSPLSGLDRLLDLNLCHNKAVDASPLKSLTQLERLWLSYNREMPESETAAVQEALPNCLCNFTIFYSTHGNWRGHERYAVVKYIFDHGVYLEWDAEVPPIEEQMKNMR